jgi:hypothetical protein
MQNRLRALIKSNSERAERMIARSEIAGLVLCLAGVFMMMQKTGYSGIFMIAGISLLALVYALHGNYLNEILGLTNTGIWVKAIKASYLTLSVTTAGILFRLQGWPGSKVMLLGGCSISAVFFIFFIYKLYFGKTGDSEEKTVMSNLLVRMMPALLIIGFLIMIALRT